MFVLTAAAELPVPVGDPEVGPHKCITHGTISQDSVEERLEGEGEC